MEGQICWGVSNVLSGSAPGVTLAGFGGMQIWYLPYALAGASQMLDNDSGQAYLVRLFPV